MKQRSAKPIREKPHRLPEEYYIGRYVDFTVSTSPRVSILTQENIYPALEELLIEAAQYYRCELAIYLFMPDHLHCILASEASDSDPLSAMKRFKQRSGFWLRQGRLGFRWQKDFYDHILRREQDLIKHICYILSNPIRAGLTATWKEYPFKGSTIYTINEWDKLR